MEGPLLPGVGEADAQYEYENNHLHETVESEAPVNNRPGVEKRRFDIEDQEKEREDVVWNREGTPRVRDGRLAGLVGLAPRPRALTARRDKACQDQRRRNETNYQQDKQAHVHV